MGKIFGVKCSDCDYEFSANVGHGMAGCGFFEYSTNSGKPDYYDYIKDEKIIADIDRLVETAEDLREDTDKYSKHVNWWGHGSAQYYCKHCNILHNRFYFRLIYTGGKYEPVYNCSKCDKKLVLVELMQTDDEEIKFKADNNLKWKCPTCGGNKLLKSNKSGIMYD